ncbi:uncharacterized protein LOC107371243 [Tetranychus urticae]|uniref:uncharacterized protein LOC107371243 n=1 Tax=Tetranychus urticae TaxID=32264 RepID=UPI00077BAF41|nr:uncharacterized protein LOC107371243 [Tetranychus urticae]
MDQMDALVVQLKLSDQTKGLENLINSLEKLSRLCKTLIHLGPRYDWKDLPYNGYRSIVKLCNLFTTNVIKPSLKSNKINRESLVGVVNLLIAMSERAIIFSKETQNPPEKTMQNIASELFLGTKQHFADIESHLEHYWGYHAFFWMTPSSRWVPYLFSLSTALIHKLPKSLLASISNEEYGTLLTYATWKATPFFPMNVSNYVNNCFSRAYSSLLCIVNGVDFQQLLVPRQSRWIVPDDGSRITKPFSESVDNSFHENLSNIDKEKNPVLCYLMKSKSLIPSGDVILHAQGGGFIIDARLFHESYLRDWVQKLDGAVIVNVIYSRFVRYPCALQEFIDVYFWLTKGGEDVIKTLGFKPRRIICLGDSAGFFLLLTMCCAVRDIQLISPSEISLYPEALMGICPFPSIGAPNVFSSFLLTYVDFFLSPSLIMHCISLYSTGILFDSECLDFDNNNENNGSETSSPPWLKEATALTFFENFYHTWIKEGKSWHDCDPDEFHSRTNKIASRIPLPYISPLLSYDLDAINDLKLSLISTEFDPCLDLCIELAKQWKGKLSFDVIENMAHGFYGYYSLSNECYKATEFCFKRLKDVCS